jgi:hypothetical protein
MGEPVIEHPPFGVPNPFVRNVAGRRRRRFALAAVAAVAAVAVVLAVALLVWLVIHLFASPSCGEGVVRQGGECVGVTDGSFDFDPAMRAIDREISRSPPTARPSPASTTATTRSR